MIDCYYSEKEGKQSISAISEKEPSRLSPTSKLQAPANADLKKTRMFVSIIYRNLSEYQYSAEYMLDVIGAGATAVADRDWRQVWVDSKECQTLENEIDQLHAEGRSYPPVAATVTTQFATPWTYQTRTLLQRQNLAFWRDPTYLMSKLSLNVIGGLFIGFTFFKSKDTIQGTQNKLFVRIILILQLLAPYSTY